MSQSLSGRPVTVILQVSLLIRFENSLDLHNAVIERFKMQLPEVRNLPGIDLLTHICFSSVCFEKRKSRCCNPAATGFQLANFSTD